MVAMICHRNVGQRRYARTGYSTIRRGWDTTYRVSVVSVTAHGGIRPQRKSTMAAAPFRHTMTGVTCGRVGPDNVIRGWFGRTSASALIPPEGTT